MKVVNGAGESDRSNNVSIPSLPDIGSVTASLTHQVWKYYDGQIRVNISFQVRHYNYYVQKKLNVLSLIATISRFFSQPDSVQTIPY